MAAAFDKISLTYKKLTFCNGEHILTIWFAMATFLPNLPVKIFHRVQHLSNISLGYVNQFGLQWSINLTMNRKYENFQVKRLPLNSFCQNSIKSARDWPVMANIFWNLFDIKTSFRFNVRNMYKLWSPENSYNCQRKKNGSHGNIFAKSWKNVYEAHPVKLWWGLVRCSGSERTLISHGRMD